MTRTEILDAARRCITVDRAATHGDAEDSFRLIADLWAAYLGAEIQPHDVAAMMVLFKAARFRSNPRHADNAVDMAGYAALAGELGGSKSMSASERAIDEAVRSLRLCEGR